MIAFHNKEKDWFGTSHSTVLAVRYCGGLSSLQTINTREVVRPLEPFDPLHDRWANLVEDSSSAIRTLNAWKCLQSLWGYFALA